MLYTGIDYHKNTPWCPSRTHRCSRLRGPHRTRTIPCLLGLLRRLARVDPVVVEACWNWGRLYDELGEIDRVEEVVSRTRLDPAHRRRADQDRQA